MFSIFMTYLHYLLRRWVISLTRSYQFLFALKILFTFYKASFFNEKVNCTEPFPRLVFPGINHRQLIEEGCKRCLFSQGKFERYNRKLMKNISLGVVMLCLIYIWIIKI